MLQRIGKDIRLPFLSEVKHLGQGAFGEVDQVEVPRFFYRQNEMQNTKVWNHSQLASV